jgi:hypothetical protein
MSSALYDEIGNHLGAYLAGRDSLELFRDWFVERTLNIHKSDDEAAMDLAYAIDLRYAEYLNGDWAENELKVMLGQMIYPTKAPLP